MSETQISWLRDEMNALRAEVGNLREEVAKLKTSVAIAGVVAAGAVSAGFGLLVSLVQ
jgi:cell division protein FtsB